VARTLLPGRQRHAGAALLLLIAVIRPALILGIFFSSGAAGLVYVVLVVEQHSAEYVGALIDLAYEDTMRRADEVRAFCERAPAE